MSENLLFRSDGVQCAGIYVRPDGPGPFPLLVMGNGIGGVMDGALEDYAREFAAAGIACFAFDYRGFGMSAGAPRQVFSIRGQLADWRAAIDFSRRLDAVDPKRVALW